MRPGMKPTIFLTGKRFGRLIVQSEAEHGKWERRWTCVCDCGNTTVVDQGSLTKGKTRSCGCFSAESTAARARILNRTHGATAGGSRASEYNIWTSMLARCTKPTCHAWGDYGGRGIRVCDRWRSSFQRFMDDIGPRPSPRYTLDRINNDGNYEPGNCRWTTRTEQNRNRRDNVRLTVNGESRVVAEWAALLGLKPGTIYKRLYLGWTTEEALSPLVAPQSRLRCPRASGTGTAIGCAQ